MPPSPPVAPQLVRRMAEVVGEQNCISEAAQLPAYECDGLTMAARAPHWWCCPARPTRWRAWCASRRAARLPIVPRGAGTGLSGGARPTPGCMVRRASRG